MVEQSSGVNPGMAWHGRNLAEIINQGKSDTVDVFDGEHHFLSSLGSLT
jgi:hypothetical protein